MLTLHGASAGVGEGVIDVGVRISVIPTAVFSTLLVMTTTVGVAPPHSPDPVVDLVLRAEAVPVSVPVPSPVPAPVPAALHVRVIKAQVVMVL